MTLELDRFKYDRGTVSLTSIDPHAADSISLLLGRRKIHAYARGECPEFVLERVANSQRLRFDDDPDRVIIGETLREPERECLAEVLNAWRNG